MFNADNRLSMAASAIWNSYEQEDQEMSLDGSGELGGRIARGMQEWRLKVIGEFGFTPKSYNEALRRSLCGEEYPHMSYGTYQLLSILEVESLEEYDDHHTVVCTLGYPGHPGAEYSTIAYLKGES
jgi:hypothetical protein